MAKEPNTNVTTGDVKVKRTRAKSGPRTVYAVIRILNEDGTPMVFPKGRVEVISFERGAEAVLAKIDGGNHPGAMYLSGVMQAGR